MTITIAFSLNMGRDYIRICRSQTELQFLKCSRTSTILEQSSEKMRFKKRKAGGTAAGEINTIKEMPN